jgi:hypothetical protein
MTAKAKISKCAVDRLPPKIKRHLVGAAIEWQDSEPMSLNGEDELLFRFETNTCAVTDLLLKKHGVFDASHVVNAVLNWRVHMELIYDTPNNASKSAHIDHHWFDFRGSIFPVNPKFKREREGFYMATNLEHVLVPEHNKNKGYFRLMKFTAEVIGV